MSALVQALLERDAYASIDGHEGADDVGHLETHISHLFFVGDRVYKLKKPVRFDFLDFSTLERRRHFCEEEVRLNRRLAPSVYLGVVHVVRDGSRYRVERDPPPDADVVDSAVEMVRLPADGMMDHRLALGTIDNSHLDHLAAKLVAFHRDAASGAGVDEFGAVDRLRTNATENFDELAAFVDADPSPLSANLLAFLRTRGLSALDDVDFFDARIRAHRIREGHGDLHAGNICFIGDDVAIYDCIEFSPRFRCADVACDLAFACMDLDASGYRGFAGYLAHRYGHVAADADFDRALRYYKTYAAIVRGKVVSLASRNPELDAAGKTEVIERARRYLHLAAAYELPPPLLLMCGPPAAGKSHAARRIAAPFEAAIVRSDVVRKQLHGLAPTDRTDSPLDGGIYSAETTRRTYDALAEAAHEWIADGRAVVVDASFAWAADRARFLAMAADAGCPALIVHLDCPPDLLRRRVRDRARAGTDPSDADERVLEHVLTRFEAPREDGVVRVVPEIAADSRVTAAVLDALIARSYD